MADANLNIILKLVDEASAKIKETMGGVDNETKKVKKTSEETTKKITNGFRESTKSIRSFRRDMALVTVAIVATYTALKDYAKYNKEAQKSVDDLDKSVSTLKYGFGALVNIITKVSPLMLFLKGMREVSGEHTGTTGLAGMLAQKEASELVEQTKRDLNDIDMLYRAGKMSAEEYYTKINEGEFLAMSMREQSMAQMRDLATLSYEVSNNEILNEQRLNEEKISLLQEYKTNFMIAHQGMKALVVTLSSSIRENLSSALSDMIMGVKSAKEAFTELGQMMIKAVLDFMIQKVVAWILEKTLLAATVVASSTAAAAVAAAWAPAAALVSLATMGGNAVPAAAGIVSVNALTAGIALGSKAVNVMSVATNPSGVILEGGATGYHSGGIIRAHSGLAVDEIPIIAQSGEGILSRRGMAALGGEGMLNRLNAGQGDSFGDIYINVYYPKMSRKEEIGELADLLGIEIQRKLRYARSA